MNNGRQRFCQDCGQGLHPGHSRVCPARQAQTPTPAPQGGANAPRNWDKEIQDLLRRVRALEVIPVVPRIIGSSVEDMRVPAPGQPRNSVNRLFTLNLGLVMGLNTSGIVFVAMPRPEGVTGGNDPVSLDIAPTMPGFSSWAEGFVSVSISSVALTYTPTAGGMVGSAFVALGFGSNSSSLPDAGTIIRMERSTSLGWQEAGQVRTVYPSACPFERYLVGGRTRNTARPWGRVHVGRSSTEFLVPSGPATRYTGSLGTVRLVVQCACVRASFQV